jgi:FkbM family methyltransferase
MYMIKKAFNHMLARVFARTCCKFPNLHLPASKARIIQLQDGCSAFLRPSFSDSARFSEYVDSLYVPKNAFTQQVQSMKPNAIIDIGANIGLSSLSLARAFPSAKVVVGVEAEKQNFLMLEKNYALWNTADRPAAGGSHIYCPVYAIAGAAPGVYASTDGVSRLPGGTSASGTFSFSSDLSRDVKEGNARNDKQSLIEHSRKITSISELLEMHLTEVPCVIVKVDIEGGEEYLFSADTSWLKQTVLLTVEIHDCMGATRSSRNLLKRLVQYDFSIVPSEDILHCYNRQILDL